MIRNRAVLLVLTAILGFPAAAQENSPAIDALEQGDIALAKRLIQAQPALLEAEGRISRYALRTPFFWAVQHGDLELARWLKAQGARVDGPYLVFDQQEFTANALALSPNASMTAYLKSLGLAQQMDVPAGASQSWTVNDDGVNLRSSPDTKASIVAKLGKGDLVRHEGHTTFRVTIGTNEAFWLRVVTKSGTEGWVFGAFVDAPWSNEE